jgi:hypothetical protein
MPDKINVMFIQSQIAYGADSRIHGHLIRHLDRSRFRVHVACTSGDGSGEPTSLEAIRRIPDVHVRPTVFVPGLGHRTSGQVARLVVASSRSPLDAAALARYIRKERIKVLHGTEKPRDAGYAVGLGRLTGAKSIVHVHVKWSNEYGRVPRWAVRNADAAFSISRYVTDTIQSMGTPAERIHTVLNCLDATDGWDPTIDGASLLDPLLAWLARQI